MVRANSIWYGLNNLSIYNVFLAISIVGVIRPLRWSGLKEALGYSPAAGPDEPHPEASHGLPLATHPNGHSRPRAWGHPKPQKNCPQKVPG